MRGRPGDRPGRARSLFGLAVRLLRYRDASRDRGRADRGFGIDPSLPRDHPPSRPSVGRVGSSAADRLADASSNLRGNMRIAAILAVGAFVSTAVVGATPAHADPGAESPVGEVAAPAAAAPDADAAVAPGSPQPAQPEKRGGAKRGGIEEIIVTAQKREQTLQEVPISVSVV